MSTPSSPPPPAPQPVPPPPPGRQGTGGRKPSAAVTRERRMEVFRLQMRGMNQTTMATVLKVNRNTIVNDVRWLKLHMREIAIEADKFQEIGNAMKFFEEMEQTAMFNFHDTDSHKAKNEYLKTAIEARERKIRLMMDAGIIDKAATNLNLEVDFSKFTNEELIRRRDTLIGELRGLGLEGGKN